MNPQDIAILCRTRRQVELVQESLTKANIPTNTKGAQPFFEYEEIKQIMGMFCWVVNPDDPGALTTFCKAFGVGAGEATIAKVYREFITEPPTFENIKAHVEGQKAKLPKKLLPVLDMAIQATTEDWNPYQLLKAMEGAFKIQEKFTKLDKSGFIKRSKVDSLFTLVDKCQSAGDIDLETFVDNCMLINPEEEDDEGVTITTIHKAKGLEWPVVFVLGISEGIIPHELSQTPEDIEQERNLLYVAMTRAKNHLYMTHGDTTQRFNDVVNISRSHFIEPVIPQISQIGNIHLTKPLPGAKAHA